MDDVKVQIKFLWIYFYTQLNSGSLESNIIHLFNANLKRFAISSYKR